MVFTSCLVAHTSHNIQPLDVTFYGTPGIYPLNPHIFDDNNILTTDPTIEEVIPPRQLHQSEANVNPLTELMTMSPPVL